MVRAAVASVQTPNSENTSHVSALTAAASSALARDIPGVGKYAPAMRGSRSMRGTRQGSKDDVPVYRARVEIGGSSNLGSGGDMDTEVMRRLETPSQISKLEQRWTSSWADSLLERLVKPLLRSVLASLTYDI